MKNLKILRKKIDSADKKLIRLLEERLSIAQKIAQAKHSLNLPLTNSLREKEIINRLKQLTSNLLLRDYIPIIFKTLFKISKDLRIIRNNSLFPFKTVGIIGLGLVGGSIAKTIKLKNKYIRIYSIKSPCSNHQQALSENIVDQEFDTIVELVKNSQLVVIAAPITTVSSIAKKISRIEKLKQKLLVIDVASVKKDIKEQFEKLTTSGVEFLATHPMSGSEKEGFSASSSTLFAGNPWIITPHKKNSKISIQKINQCIRFLGSSPKIISANQHDSLIVPISHLVFLISTYFFAFVYEKKRPTIDLAGDGFKSITRLAGGNEKMHSKIFNENSRNIQSELIEFIKFINTHQLNKHTSLKFFQRYKEKRDQII